MMRGINFVRKIIGLLALALAVKIMPKDEGLDALLDAVIPWMEAEQIRVLKKQQESAY